MDHTPKKRFVVPELNPCAVYDHVCRVSIQLRDTGDARAVCDLLNNLNLIGRDVELDPGLNPYYAHTPGCDRNCAYECNGELGFSIAEYMTGGDR